VPVVDEYLGSLKLNIRGSPGADTTGGESIVGGTGAAGGGAGASGGSAGSVGASRVGAGSAGSAGGVGGADGCSTSASPRRRMRSSISLV
jgi:hypothetical protein